MQVQQRLVCLRKWLVQNGFAACVIPQSDPHLSEYLEPYDEVRAYFSGFTGSAGTLVVTTTHAGLWTDSRYFIQAEEQLQGTGIELLKQGIEGTLSIKDWLKQQVGEQAVVAANAALFSAEEWENLAETLSMQHHAGFEKCWRHRPSLSCRLVTLFDDAFAGESAIDKLSALRKQLSDRGVTACFVAALDDIAWLLNVRGADMEYVPVVRSYLWVDAEQVCLWVDARKLTAEVSEYLQKLSIQVLPYET